VTAASQDPGFEAKFLARYEAAKAFSATLEGRSLADRLAALPKAEIDAILDSLSRQDRAALLYAWKFWARPKQIVPTLPHFVMLWLAGRAFGKTRTAAERIRDRIYDGAKLGVLIGPTWREVLRYMVGGKKGAKRNGSGLLDVFPAHERRHIQVKEQKGEIHFDFCGAMIHLVSDEQPELRGGAYEIAWLDEICKWRHLKRLWDNLEFTMREQTERPPEILVTTTPRPMRFLKELVADPDTITIVGKLDENGANLAPQFVRRIVSKYDGTRLGRQERDGELLSDNEGALFQQGQIDATRVMAAPTLARIVVAIDPAIATNEDNDETGIVAMGIGHDGHLYVLGDASGKLSPEAWGAAALKLYDQWKADAFVGERNRGGDLVATNMRATIREKKGSASVAKIIEVHATRNKQVRAEPVATLHEQGRLHFVGVHPKIEAEITEWDQTIGGVSPNRLDALVWGAYELAKLGEEIPTDPREAFKGFSAAARAVQSSPARPNVATVAVPRGPWGRI
jgi:phage terminase large subunit-like protein